MDAATYSAVSSIDALELSLRLVLHRPAADGKLQEEGAFDADEHAGPMETPDQARDALIQETVKLGKASKLAQKLQSWSLLTHEMHVRSWPDSVISPLLKHLEEWYAKRISL